ncbi:MAG TPA: zinc ABC transporter ATP-binding protein AztA [Acidimicrobiales bacterium]|nr:zinc ABC transporter ATP-binding protein AztA [Acidimicrobiales bacterium]
MPGAVTVEDLEVRYGQRVALQDCSLSLPAGSTLAVIGPNGSGKSTLLRAIAGLERPTRGRIDTGGERVALVLQSTDVDRSVPISVRATVRMARYATLGLLRRFRAEDHRAVDEALDRLELTDLADRQLHELSGGQRQRVLVAQGLAQDAAVLLLDEPVTGLDVVSRDRILDVVAAERDAGRAIAVTTHDLDDAGRCDQVLLLATRPIALGTPAEVLCEEHLLRAFDGRFLRVGDRLLLDDPHHHAH